MNLRVDENRKLNRIRSKYLTISILQAGMRSKVFLRTTTEYLLCAPESEILPRLPFNLEISFDGLSKGRIGEMMVPPVKWRRSEG